MSFEEPTGHVIFLAVLLWMRGEKMVCLNCMESWVWLVGHVTVVRLLLNV
jgi:hypothetical protein